MEYREFLSTLEPVMIGIDQASCSLDRDAYWSAPKHAQRMLSSSYALSKATEDYFDVKASFLVALHWSLDDGSVVEALKVQCVFYGHFHVATTPLDRSFAKKFAESESWVVFWPYFRQFVSDTTSRMAIPPVVVPWALGPGEAELQEKRQRLPAAQKKKTRKK